MDCHDLRCLGRYLGCYQAKMNPDPLPTLEERVRDFERQAERAQLRCDYAFAQELSNFAFRLRMQDKQEKLNAITRGTPEATCKPPPKAD